MSKEKDIRIAYENLANAVVLQAYKDYVHSIKYNERIRRKRINEFFHSKWYRQLTTVPCDVLIQQAFKEAKEAEEVKVSQVKVCDVCGEIINEDKTKSYTVVSRDITKERVEQYDMCSDCFDKFLMMVHEHE